MIWRALRADGKAQDATSMGRRASTPPPALRQRLASGPFEGLFPQEEEDR